MNRHIRAVTRYSAVLLLPAVAYAVSTQMATHGNKVDKNQTHAKSSQHIATHNASGHNKRTTGRSVPASHMNGNHLVGGGLNAHKARAHQHALGRGRSSKGASPTPTPTPATETATPAPNLTASPTASPSG
jgi:hypothetical protein